MPGIRLHLLRSRTCSVIVLAMAATPIDPDIAGDGPMPSAAPRRQQQQQRTARPALGKVRIFIIVAAVSGGLWHQRLGDAGAADIGDNDVVVGLVAAQWAWAAARTAALDPMEERMRASERRSTQAQAMFGYLRYIVLEAIRVAPVPMPDSGGGGSKVTGLLMGLRGDRSCPGGPSSTSTVRQFLLHWQGRGAALERGLVRLVPLLARAVVAGCFVMHVVLVTRRTQRSRFLVRGDPSRRRLAALLHHARGVPVRRARGDGPDTKRSLRIFDAALLCDWLETTNYIKDIRKTASAAFAWARLFSRRLEQTPQQLMQSLALTSYETLRRARVRLDAVSMLTFRQYIRALPDDINLFVYADASPSLKGIEMFSVSLDIHHFSEGEHWFERRLMPIVSLSRDQLGAEGKTLALLWVLWLALGPDLRTFRQYLSRIRALVSDMGTERKIAGIGDLVGNFYSIIDRRFEGTEDIGQTFPRCLSAPGWMHCWDVILRRALASLSWFPSFMDKLRALVSFLRVATLRGQVVQDMKDGGLPIIGEMIAALSLVSIASWRWRTLVDVLSQLDSVIDSLRHHFRKESFKTTRDPARLRRITAALESPSWRNQFAFTLWLGRWLTRIMNWGGGCGCCPTSGTSATTTCPWKGRRMSEAWGFSQAALKEGLDECNRWQPQTFQEGDRFWREAQGCVRAAYALAQDKMLYLNRLPYMLCRLDRPGVRDEALAQYARAPARDHHKVTNEFLGASSRLRVDVLRLSADGSGCTPALRAAIAGLQAIPLDDSVAESPHSRIKKLGEHSRAASFAWLSSSMRLMQNIKDVRSLVPMLGMDLEEEWGRFTSVLQVQPRRVNRSMRLSRGCFNQRLYSMSHFGAAPAHRRPDDGDGDCQDPGDPAAPARTVKPGSEVGLGQALPRPPPAELSVKLLRAYFAASLQPMRYLSIPCQHHDGDGDAPAPMFFQLLALDAKSITVDTYTEAKEPALFEVTVLPLQRWSHMRQDPFDFGPIPEVDVFGFEEEPEKIDILKLTGADVSDRQDFLHWEARESDVEGCYNLHSPDLVQPCMMLCDSRIPILCLMDALAAGGWVGCERLVRHSQKSRKREYDQRQQSLKRHYLMAVLASSDLFQAGVCEFNSSQSDAWYRYLLKFKQQPPPKMSAAELKNETEQGAEVQLPSLAKAVAPLPRSKTRSTSGPALLGDRAAPALLAHPSSSHAGGWGPQESVAPGGKDEAQGPMGALGDTQGDPDIAIDMPAATAVADPPEFLEGVKVHNIGARYDLKWSYHSRISVRCKHPGHRDCSRSRSLALDVEVIGERAAYWWLGAWLRGAEGRSQQEHREYKPTLDEVRSYRDSL